MLAGSVYYEAERVRRKEFEGVVAEKKGKEKNEAWIRELEARDREDKEWRVRMGKVKAAQAEGAEKEKEKAKEEEVVNEKSGGILAAVNKLVPKAKKRKNDGQDGEKEKQEAGGIFSAAKKELVGTEKEKKDGVEVAVEPAKTQPAEHQVI